MVQSRGFESKDKACLVPTVSAEQEFHHYMNLTDYGRILLRRGWIVLLLAFLAAGAAYFLSTRQTPVYRAIQKVLIQPSRTDLSLTESSRQLLNSYRSLMDSTFVAAKVIDNLQLDMTPQALKADVEVVASAIDLGIEISADSTDPGLAARIAQEWGEQLVDYRNVENQKVRREDQVNATLQDNPQPALLAPRPAINALAGGILGILIGAIVVFVMEYRESSVIRRREDLERMMGIPVLAAIPE
jgi:capsular polysaccharide biosynthesis protein